jgi:cell division protein FtsL
MGLCICIALVAIVMALTIRHSARPLFYDFIDEFEVRDEREVDFGIENP